MGTRGRRRRTAVRSAVALAVIATAAGAGTANAGQPTAGTTWGSVASGVAGRSVTLITGDKVFLDAAGHVVRVAPGRNRKGMPFQIQQVHGHLYVLPADARSLLGKGTLDRRLFDVKELVADGYDDARRTDLPLIVTYGTAQRSATRSELRAHARSERSLPSVGGDVLHVDKSQGAALWEALTAGGGEATQRTAAPGIAHVWLDGKVTAAVDENLQQIGAPAAWKAGYDGKGVKVAVLDTGIDETHPDLRDRVVQEKNFSESGDTVDRVGHGTHVASIIAGSGVKSAGLYQGVAPGTQLLVGKVLGDEGFGDDAAVIEGMEWAVAQGAQVVNMSLGEDDSPGVDAVEEAVNTLSARSGTLFVVSAGNAGEGGEVTLGTPGTAAAALTVGAVDKQDALAPFSSRGPTADGDLKPDITAPGVDIVAAAAAQGNIGTQAADGYVSLSGTSMAAPHVTGAAALLAEQHPDWSGARLKAQLTASAKATPDVSSFAQGSGRVDVAKALDEMVTTSPTSLGFGLQQYPHADDQPVTRQVTYHNSGDAPISLNLSTEAFAADGKPAPTGMFTVTPAQLTVPAGGEASASVTADTRVGSVDGTFGGSVVATTADGATSARTAVGVQREIPSYNLTLKARDLEGKPTQDFQASISGLDNDQLAFVSGTDGSSDSGVTVRLPKGRYSLEALLGVRAKTVLFQPELTVDHDMTASVDARKSRPVDITVPDKAAKNGSAMLYYFNTVGSEHSYTTYEMDDGYHGVRVGMAGKQVPAAKAFVDYTGRWTDTRKHVNYRLGWHRTGDLSGFTAHLGARQLVKVPVTIGASAPGKRGSVVVSPLMPNGNWYDPFYDDVKLPLTATDYFLPNSIRWHYTVSQTVLHDDGEAVEVMSESKPLTFASNRHYALRFNVGVFGPSLPSGPPWPGSAAHGVSVGAVRTGDTMRVLLPMFGDAADHLGDSLYSKAESTLSADGKQISVSDTPLDATRYDVPGHSALYRLTTDVSRPATISAVSTRLTAAWTFRSAHVAAAASVKLPLSVIRFSPKLASNSTAKAGRPFSVPFTVQGAATVATAKHLDFQVSYDHGKHWHAAKAANGALSLRHPAATGTVSLRAHLVDSHGNTMNQTVYDAYRTTK